MPRTTGFNTGRELQDTSVLFFIFICGKGDAQILIVPYYCLPRGCIHLIAVTWAMTRPTPNLHPSVDFQRTGMLCLLTFYHLTLKGGNEKMFSLKFLLK